MHFAESGNLLMLLKVFVCRPGKKERKSDCGEWQWSVCVANEGDCGPGTREGTRTGIDCKQTIKTQRCKIPCNWKKKFGGKRRLSRLPRCVSEESPLHLTPIPSTTSSGCQTNNGPLFTVWISKQVIRDTADMSAEDVTRHHADTGMIFLLWLFFFFSGCTAFRAEMCFCDMPRGLLFP